MNKHPRSRTTILCIILLNLSFVLQFQSPVGASASATTYTIIDLGTLPPTVPGGGTRSDAYAINNKGEVVGVSYTFPPGGGDVNQAFLWTPTGGIVALPGNAGFALDINDSSQVVGFGVFPPDPADPTLSSFITEDLRINNLGQVVGRVFFSHYPCLSNPCSYVRPFLWTLGQGYVDLGVLPGGTDGKAYGINDIGQIVGSVDFPSGCPHHWFLWQSGVMNDSGCGIPQDINKGGVVIGYQVNPGGPIGSAGVIGGSTIYPFCPPGIPVSSMAINDKGQAVGSPATFGVPGAHAVLWELTPENLTSIGGIDCYGFQELNSLIPSDSGWFLVEARDINEVGQIVGTGIINGQVHAFLLTPLATISGNVWVDSNRNGAREPGESNYPNAIITLTLPGAATKTATTDPLGNYSFANLPGGNYTVTLTLPSGYTQTTTNPVKVTIGPSTTVNFGIVRTADLAIVSIAASPEQATVDSNLTYTLTIRNKGPSGATGVTITDTLPANVTYVSASTGCGQSSGIVTCSLGSLANLADTAVSIVVRPITGGALPNGALVTAGEFDPNLIDNLAAIKTTVLWPGPTCEVASGLSVPRSGTDWMLTQGFANYLPKLGGFHAGEDWGGEHHSPAGRPIFTIGPGKVVKISDLTSRGLGQLIVIVHGGNFTIPARAIMTNSPDGQRYQYPAENVTSIYSVYLHVAPQPGIKLWQCVKGGQQLGQQIATVATIGQLGSTSACPTGCVDPHLHLEIRHPDWVFQTAPGALRDSDWSLVGKPDNWVNGYYRDVQVMVDAGVRYPTGFLESNPVSR